MPQTPPARHCAICQQVPALYPSDDELGYHDPIYCVDHKDCDPDSHSGWRWCEVHSDWHAGLWWCPAEDVEHDSVVDLRTRKLNIQNFVPSLPKGHESLRVRLCRSFPIWTDGRRPEDGAPDGEYFMPEVDCAQLELRIMRSMAAQQEEHDDEEDNRCDGL